jgi:hypothetical protein
VKGHVLGLRRFDAACRDRRSCGKPLRLLMERRDREIPKGMHSGPQMIPKGSSQADTRRGGDLPLLRGL